MCERESEERVGESEIVLERVRESERDSETQ